MEQSKHIKLSLADSITYVIDQYGNIQTRSIISIVEGIAEKEQISLEDAYFELMEFSYCQEPRRRPDGEEAEPLSYIKVGTDKVLRIKVTEDFLNHDKD